MWVAAIQIGCPEGVLRLGRGHIDFCGTLFCIEFCKNIYLKIRAEHHAIRRWHTKVQLMSWFLALFVWTDFWKIYILKLGSSITSFGGDTEKYNWWIDHSFCIDFCKNLDLKIRVEHHVIRGDTQKYNRWADVWHSFCWYWFLESLYLKIRVSHHLIRRWHRKVQLMSWFLVLFFVLIFEKMI